MSSIRIVDITHDSTVDGPGLRTVIWFGGCYLHCPGCHNKELQDADSGNLVDIEEVAEIINNSKHITLSGGDPLFQLDALNELLGLINNEVDIWLYTGLEYDKVSELLQKAPNILTKVSIIKCGPFIESLKDPNIKFRGSRNQEFYKIDDGKIYNITEIIDRGDFNV